jgi:hypothetical protein
MIKRSRGANSLGFPGNGYGHLAHHHVHHGEMFQVNEWGQLALAFSSFRGVKEKKRPTENDLGRSIMACADDRRVELVVESRAPKVDQSDVYVSQNVLLLGSLYLESPRQSFSA